MPVVIQRVEDLQKVSQLATGALFYCSQSGTAFNTNTLDIVNAMGATNNFATPTVLNNTGQNLYSLITGFSGELKSYVNWNNQNLTGNSGLISVDWNGRILYDITGNTSVMWNTRTLFNSWILTAAIKSNQDGNSSVDTNPRLLWDKSGAISVFWSSRSLNGNWKINGTGIATSPELAATGTNLQNQINNLVLNAGVSKINGISGNITFTGQGGTNITTIGQTITISGASNSSTIVPSVLFTTNIDWSSANTFFSTLSGVKTVTFSNTLDGQTIVVGFSGLFSGSLVWPSNVKWPNNLVPTPSSGAIDIYTFVQIKTGIYSTVVQNFPL